MDLQDEWLNLSDACLVELLTETQDQNRLSKILGILKDTCHQRHNSILNMICQSIQHLQQQRPFQSSHVTKATLFLIEHLCQHGNTLQSKLALPTIYHLSAATKGWLASSSGNNSRIKQIFMRGIKREPYFWGLNTLHNFQLYLMDKTTGYKASFSSVQYLHQLTQIEYLLDFLVQNRMMLPVGIDIYGCMFRLMLCMRMEGQRDRKLANRIIDFVMNSPNSTQTLKSNFKFATEFLMNQINQKDCLYCPYRPFLACLAKLPSDRLQQLIASGSIGLLYGQQELNNCLSNCIKMGITESNSKIIMAFVRLAERNNKYAELLYAFENNISKLFIFLKHPNLFTVAFKLLKYFVLSPFPTVSLFEKFIAKAIPFVEVVKDNQLIQFLSLLQVVASLYSQTTLTHQLKEKYEMMLDQSNLKSSEQITKQIKAYSWQLGPQSCSNEDIGCKSYRGLINIGNSCYLNSFLQVLFMTFELRKQILTVSTLALEQRLIDQRCKEKGNPEIKESQLVRQHVRPLAELQRLFALLLRSKRTAISPLPVRNVCAFEFRNSHQQDAIQFGRSLVDLMHKSGFPNYFQGEVTTRIVCSSCQHPRERKEAFIDLILCIEGEQEQLKDIKMDVQAAPAYTNVQKSQGEGKAEKSLKLMVQSLFQAEIISNLTCDKCQFISQKSIKSQFISRFPNYLILTIKRFSYSAEEKKNKKITTKVTIDEQITINNAQFEIYSLIVHRGPSASSGHYFAFCRDDAEWLCLNDSEVNKFTDLAKVMDFLESSQEDTPYLLFYRLRDHFKAIQEELIKPLILRTPLENYVQKDNLSYVKSMQKKPAIALPLFKMDYFRDDDEDDPRNNRQNDWNRFIS